MIKINKMLPWLLTVFMAFPFTSCGGSSDKAIAAPMNLAVDYVVVGATATNPAGDGSGVVKFVASATDATTYTFTLNGTTEAAQDGRKIYTFTTPGTNDYTVTVTAFNADNASISKKVTVSVYVSKGEGATTGESFKDQTLSVATDADYSTLVYADEFEKDGDVPTADYNQEIGGNGWGNAELQYYTNSNENAYVKDGMLHIVAKRQSMQGCDYTSARLTTKGLHEFQYGRFEIRAQLPSGIGTWPAIWMLGSNISTVEWPACGEIDIMEHVGYDQDVIHHSLHTTGSHGATVNTAYSTIAGVSTDFHVYICEWTPTNITFSVDDKKIYTYTPPTMTNTDWPFNQPFFFIFNIAMGGNWGGAGGPIPSSFTQCEMLIDYIRVYQ